MTRSRSRIGVLTLVIAAQTAALTACKARRDGAGVRDTGDAGETDVNAQLSALAADILTDVAGYGVAIGPLTGRDGLALDDAPPVVLSADELDRLRMQAAEINNTLRRAQTAFDRQEGVRQAKKDELTVKLAAAVKVLEGIQASDTERYAQGLADIQRAMDGLKRLEAPPAVTATPPAQPATPARPATPAQPATPPKPAERQITCEAYGSTYFPRYADTRVFIPATEVPGATMSKAVCESFLRGRKNGLICSEAARHWGIFRASDGVMLSGNEFGIATSQNTNEACLAAITGYSTPRYACVAGGIWVCDYEIKTGSQQQCFKGEAAWTECLADIKARPQ